MDLGSGIFQSNLQVAQSSHGRCEEVISVLRLMAVGGGIWERGQSMSVCDQGWGSVAVLTQ